MGCDRAVYATHHFVKEWACSAYVMLAIDEDINGNVNDEMNETPIAVLSFFQV